MTLECWAGAEVIVLSVCVSDIDRDDKLLLRGYLQQSVSRVKEQMMARNAKLSGLSVNELQRELVLRQRGVQRLIKKHARLVQKASALESQIAELGGSIAAGGIKSARRRPKNDMNLVDTLAKVLDGKTMSVTEVSEAVQKAGYKTTSPSFRVIVNQALINSGKFKRVERGRYTAKA